MTSTVRALTPEDRPAWERLFRAYADFYAAPVRPDAEAAVWDWIFDPANDFWCDLAIDDAGTVIGFVQYQLIHRSLGGAMVCYLSDLFVDPDVRGRGAGRQMIDHVFAFAKRRGLSNVRWLTQDFNYAGRRLYDSYARKSDFILYSVPVE